MRAERYRALALLEGGLGNPLLLQHRLGFFFRSMLRYCRSMPTRTCGSSPLTGDLARYPRSRGVDRVGIVAASTSIRETRSLLRPVRRIKTPGLRVRRRRRLLAQSLITRLRDPHDGRPRRNRDLRAAAIAKRARERSREVMPHRDPRQSGTARPRRARS